MAYWLMKSEPNAFSIDDLADSKDQITHWDGIRNYQVRNWLRDEFKVDDLAFFYHSNCKVPGIIGIMKVIKAGYPDFTARNQDNKYFDPKATAAKPIWYMVDVQLIRKFNHIIALETLKQQSTLASMPLVKKGNRLSIMPVSSDQWNYILSLEK